MSERGAPAGGDDARRLIPDLVVPPMTFIVRLSATPAGGVIGVIEHPGTGRKERFEGIEGISQVIAALRLSVGGPDVTPGPAGLPGAPGDSRAPPRPEPADT